MSTLTEKIPSTEKIPAPVFALVGATDAAATLATHAAQAVNERIAAMERPSSDDARSALKQAGQQAREQARTSARSIDLTTVDPRNLDLTKVDPRNLDLTKVDPRNRDLNVELPKIDLSTAAAYALELAAAVEKKYDELVVRGERIVAELRGEEHVTAPSVDDLVDVVEAPAAPVKPVKPVKPAAKKATKPVKKAAAPSAETVADESTQG
jgi:hypothetical protein